MNGNAEIVLSEQKDPTTKPFYLSKVIWLNILAIFFVYLQVCTGCKPDYQIQIIILAILNLFFRFKTKKRLTIK
jgi:hypothetical protein